MRYPNFFVKNNHYTATELDLRTTVHMPQDTNLAKEYSVTPQSTHYGAETQKSNLAPLVKNIHLLFIYVALPVCCSVLVLCTQTFNSVILKSDALIINWSVLKCIISRQTPITLQWYPFPSILCTSGASVRSRVKWWRNRLL